MQFWFKVLVKKYLYTNNLIKNFKIFWDIQLCVLPSFVIDIGGGINQAAVIPLISIP